MDLKSTFPIGLKRAAAMVILRYEQQFLLLKRIRPPFVGHYLPVGGKLNPYEDPRSAAIRETFEETGIQLQYLNFGGILIETSPVDYNWQSSIYIADIPFQEPPTSDEGTLQWIHFDQIPSIPTPPTDLLIYQYLMQGQPFVFNAIYDAALNLISMTEEINNINIDL